MNTYRHFFAFEKEPFAQDISLDDLYPLVDLKALLDRFHYALRLGAVCILTGEIGSGKSTSLRYASSKLHPSEYKVLPLLAHSGTLKEFLRQLVLALDAECQTYSLPFLLKTIQGLIRELVSRKQQPILILDEAHLLRSEVFSHLHTGASHAIQLIPLVIRKEIPLTVYVKAS